VVTKTLASKLAFNIDPQHTEKRSDTSAILEALKRKEELKEKLKDKSITMVTERADVDSAGAMAIIDLIRSDQTDKLNDQELIARVQQINDFDNFTSNSKWQLKSIDEAICANTKIAGIHKAMGDISLSLGDKVSIMKEWLVTGKQPKKYIEAFNQDVAKIKASLADGNMKLYKTEKGIAIVESTLPLGTVVGYTLSPVVIAINNKFIDPATKQEIVKYTICQYTGMDCVDFLELTKALNNLEGNTQGKWGGNPNLIGSPMGVGTKLKKEDIIAYTDYSLKVNLLDIIGQVSKDADKPTGIDNINVTDHTNEAQKGLIGVAK
jgi:hypothetical protein